MLKKIINLSRMMCALTVGIFLSGCATVKNQNTTDAGQSQTQKFYKRTVELKSTIQKIEEIEKLNLIQSSIKQGNAGVKKKISSKIMVSGNKAKVWWGDNQSDPDSAPALVTFEQPDLSSNRVIAKIYAENSTWESYANDLISDIKSYSDTPIYFF